MWDLHILKKNVFLFVIIIYFLTKDNCKKIVAYSVNNTSLSSSVFCNNYKNNSKRCIFLNLCYNFHSKFIFSLTEKSIISGLNNKNDLKNIFPTSVLNHSALPLKISIMYANNFSNYKVYEREVFLLHRFKPDNIMHVVHDDILPLFATYRDLCLSNVSECALKYDLIFSDENIDETFLEWYRAFSKNEPFKLSKLNKSVTHCFTKVNVGLSVDSVIFQYGFLQNRGPTELSVNQVQLIMQFKAFMYSHFEINQYQTNNVVFMARKVNRKILNEEYVENIILKIFKRELNASVKLLNVDLSINSSKEVLQAIAEANFLIGMHGSGMFLSLFLPENSVVVEMFPYGINKELVSPLFVMSSIPGIWFRYFSWENTCILNSFPHPEYSPILGGLTHLQREKQIDTFSKTANISKECCNDSVFLSRMYQDTMVDDTLMKIISYSLKNHSKESFDFTQIFVNEWFFPGIVQNITCYKNASNLILSWNRPLNIDWSNNHYYYDLSIQMYRHNLSVFTSTSFLNLKLNPDISAVKIWIKCNLPGIEGLDTFITC